VRIGVIGAGRVGTAFAALLARAGNEIVAVAGRGATAERAAAWLPGVRVLPPVRPPRSATSCCWGSPTTCWSRSLPSSPPRRRWPPAPWVTHVSGSTGLDVLRRSANEGPVAWRRIRCRPSRTSMEPSAPCRGVGSRSRPTTTRASCWVSGSRPSWAPSRSGSATISAAVSRRRRLRLELPRGDDGRRRALVRRIGRARSRRSDASAADGHARQRREVGDRGALTGPAVRGDTATITRNLEALAEHAPDTIAAYVAMCRVALDLAVGAGRLSEAGRAAVVAVLDRWDDHR
jgi:Uncharacterized conserved protein